VKWCSIPCEEFKALGSRGIALSKADHPAGNEIQAGGGAEFPALGKKNLQTQANTQEWLSALHGLHNGINQVQLLKAADAVPECTDTGQHQRAGIANCLRGAGYQGGMARLFQGLLHAAQISHSVINYCDHKACEAKMSLRASAKHFHGIASSPVLLAMTVIFSRSV
jgi:hypothetical protein